MEVSTSKKNPEGSSDTRKGMGNPDDQEAEAASHPAKAPPADADAIEDRGLFCVRTRARSSSQHSREGSFSAHGRISNSPATSTPGGGRGGWRHGSLRMLDESEDVSALSMELAVAENSAPNSRILSPSTRRGRSQSMVDAQPMGTGPTAWGLPSHRDSCCSNNSTNAHPGPDFSAERGQRSMTQVEEVEHVVERARQHSHAPGGVVMKQGVIRPHRRQPSRPSVVDLFNLIVPAEEARATELSPSPHQPDWRQNIDEAQVAFDPQGPSGSCDDDTTCDDCGDTGAGGEQWADVIGQKVERQVSPAVTKSTSPGGRNATFVAARARNKTPLMALFEEPETEELDMAGDTTYGGIYSGALTSTNGARMTDKLGFSQKFGDAFGTVAVRRPSSGPGSPGMAWGVDQGDIAVAQQDKVEDLEALENGNGHVVWPRSETAKTVSQTGTPASKSGTPTSSRSVAPLTYVARRPSRAGSMSSSYLDSGEVDPQGRQPSARIRNEAKHVSEQKRGVTTSYKSEEQSKQAHKISFFLVVLGVLTGVGSHGIDIGIVILGDVGNWVVTKGGEASGENPMIRFFLYWMYVFTLTAVAALMTSFFAPGVMGSGIPAMKYMMDTDDLAKKLRSFSLTALFVKASGLLLVGGGGLNVGREGPYTHMAGMVSYQLIKNVSFFNGILNKETVLRQVLAASVAAGVSSTFAATIGGVLFSIEITTLYYDMGNYFKAFVAAISGTVAVSLVRTLAEGSPAYIEETFSADKLKAWQYAPCALMGIVCGFLGPVYVNFRISMLKLARRWGKYSIRYNKDRKWEYVRASTRVACLVATVTAVLSYFPGEFTRTKPFATFENLLADGSLLDSYSAAPLGSIFLSLPVSIVIVFITAALGTSIGVPSGDFIQTSVMGALVGRLVGESMKANLSESAGVVPSTFALVGAAGLSCGATQTISAAVVIMEMTGSFELNKPILLAAVLAFGFSRRFGLNVYDSVMALNGLESLYGLDMRRSEEMTAKDIMETKMNVVPCHTTVGELVELLRGDQGGKGKFESYPVVAGFDGMAFIGTISRKNLVYIVLTGGTKTCHDLGYFEYMVQQIPKSDVAASLDRIAAENEDLIGRLPKEVKHAVFLHTNGTANTVRALKDKLGNFATDLSFMRTTRTFGRVFSGQETKKGASHTRSRDPRDRNQGSSMLNLSILLKAKFEEQAIEDPYDSRPVDLTLIASRASRDVQIDRSVWKAHESMPLKNVYLLFANLRCIRLFVIAGDRLTGVISRSILYQAMSTRETPADASSSNSERHYAHRWAVTSRRKKKKWYDLLLGRGVHSSATTGL